MKTTVRGRISIGLVLSAVMLLLIVAADFRTNQSYQQVTDQLNRVRQIDVTASSLLTMLLNAETGQRGYILTGNASYLTPYNIAVQSINTTDSALKNLTAGNSNLTFYYYQLQPLVSEKLDELNASIVVRQTQGFAVAQAIINANSGETYMNQIRDVIAHIISADDSAQNQLQTSTTQLATQRLDFIYLFGVSMVAIIAFTYYALRQEFIKEDALLSKESRSRRQTELLQDILTHDIRNYSQISKSNAEILREGLDADEIPLADTIIKAVDGSSDLIERTKTMARIISTDDASLRPVELGDSIERALSLISKAYPDKSLILSSPLLGGKLEVIADDLLDEVFVNVLSNAVRYTSETPVPVDIRIEDVDGTQEGTETETSKGRRYLKVSITDHGRGIPDGMKEKVFTRYQNSASGSGLGLSIVHALVVDRYSGRVRVSNRVQEDYTKGTTVEIWLPKA